MEKTRAVITTVFVVVVVGRVVRADVEEGALLPSPTREKLMPTTPKNDESYSSQRGSPKKTSASRHGSPQKGSPQKSPKKVGKHVTKGTWTLASLTLAFW